MWTPDLTSSSIFLELSGVLFTAYVVMARRNREAARSQLEVGGEFWEGLEAARPPPLEPFPASPSVEPVGLAPAPRPTPAEPRVTAANLRRLTAERGQGAVPVLAHALGHPDPAIGEAAANLLGELGGPAALRALLDADAPVASVTPFVPSSRRSAGPTRFSGPSQVQEGPEDLHRNAPEFAGMRAGPMERAAHDRGPPRSGPLPPVEDIGIRGRTPAPRSAPPATAPQPEAEEVPQGSWAPQSLQEAFETPFSRPAGGPPDRPVAEDEGLLPVLKLYEPLARNDFKALHRYCPHDPRDLDEEGLAEVLLRLIEDRSAKPALRYFALKNLVRFRHRDIAETLEDMLADPLPLVRYAAADALAVHGNEGAVALLVEALEDVEGSVRASAAHTLAVLGGDMAIRPLLSLRDDPDEVVRYAARRALDAIGKRKKITKLLKQA